MKIRNINEKYGDAIEFDSVEEMEQSILACGAEAHLPDDGLREGRDYDLVPDSTNAALDTKDMVVTLLMLFRVLLEKQQK